MQGVIKSYDPVTGDGVVVRDTDLADVDLAANALEGSVFRMLRQGQRVVFELDGAGRATALRFGSEVDMGTPGFPRDVPAIAAVPAGDGTRAGAEVDTPSPTDDASAVRTDPTSATPTHRPEGAGSADDAPDDQGSATPA